MVEIKQRKTCRGCRALTQDSVRGYCSIFYDTQQAIDSKMRFDHIKPLEPCPKPLTVTDYMDAHKNYKKK